MKVLIISNGQIRDYKHIKNACDKYDFIICVNGGTRHAYKLNLIPNMIIGDMDSIDKPIMEHFSSQNIITVKYNRDKDKTDTKIAVDMAVNMNAEEILLIGCIGSRMDHTIANVLTMLGPAKSGIRIWMKDDKNDVYITDDHICIDGTIGDYLSLIPFEHEVLIKYTKGLHYELNNSVLSLDNPSFGISNIFADEKAVISVGEGVLIIIKSTD